MPLCDGCDELYPAAELRDGLCEECARLADYDPEEDEDSDG